MFLKLGFFAQGERTKRSATCSLKNKVHFSGNPGLLLITHILGQMMIIFITFQKEGCCMYDVWMKPSDFGIQNVIAPSRVNIRACAGKCFLENHHAVSDYDLSHNHVQLITLYSSSSNFLYSFRPTNGAIVWPECSK